MLNLLVAGVFFFRFSSIWQAIKSIKIPPIRPMPFFTLLDSKICPMPARIASMRGTSIRPWPRAINIPLCLLRVPAAIVAAVIFIVIGISLKMALFPLHFWLPDVYTYAPSAVTALIAPLMTKVAAYVLIRMLISVFTPVYLTDLLPVTSVISWLAAAGIIIGSVMAIAQQDFRRMLAYSSVAQISYVALGIGLANPIGLIGGLLHIINHAFMKGCLFQIAGGIRYQTGTWDIKRFAGLGRKMPWTMAAFTVAALSMIGIPPACGFFSKWYLVLGCIDANNWVFVAVIIISSLLNAIYFFRVLEKVYISQPQDDGATNKQLLEPPREMLVPILILAAGILILGIINAVIVTRILEPVVMW